MSAKQDILKKALIKAMQVTLGNVAESCKTLGCSRNTYYEYYKSDPEFKAEIDEIAESNLDLVEGKLFELIKGYQHKETRLFSYKGKIISKDITKIYAPDAASIKFYLSTKGKSRGYVEKQQIEYVTADPFDGMTEEEIDELLAEEGIE